jgi:myosin heavy subunit
MKTSETEFVRDLFEEDADSKTPRSRMTRGSVAGKGTGKMTVGGKFQMQLEALMSVLNSVEPQYVRCIKSNPQKRPDVFDGALSFEQLKYSGVFEAVIIRQSGYPFRLKHK